MSTINFDTKLYNLETFFTTLIEITGTNNTTGNIVPVRFLYSWHAFQAIMSGSGQIVLEGSLNSTDFVTLNTYNSSNIFQYEGMLVSVRAKTQGTDGTSNLKLIYVNPKVG